MPEFFSYRHYWVIVAVALAFCAALGYALAGWLGAVVGGAIYAAHESVVIYFSWRPHG